MLSDESTSDAERFNNSSRGLSVLCRNHASDHQQKVPDYRLKTEEAMAYVVLKHLFCDPPEYQN